MLNAKWSRVSVFLAGVASALLFFAFAVVPMRPAQAEAAQVSASPDVQFLNPKTLYTPHGYTHVVDVRSGRTVFIAGQVAFDREGNLVGAGDIKAQAEQVFKNLQAALAAAGGSFKDVVKLNYYITDAAGIPIVREVRDRYINAQTPPASTAVVVARLFGPELLIEVEAVAALPETVRMFPAPR